MRDEDIIKDVEETIKFLEKLYSLWIDMCRKRQRNLKSVNSESLAKLVKIAHEKGRINNKEDIITYIELILQD